MGKYDKAKTQAIYRKLMELLAEAMHEQAAMIVTAQELASTGGPRGPSVGPHLEALLIQGKRFDLISRQIDGTIQQVKSQAEDGSQ